MRSPGGPRPEICNPTKLVQPGCHMEPWVGLAAGSAGCGPAGRPAVHRSTARPPPGHGPPPPCQRKAALWGKESLPIWPPEWVAGYLRGGSPRELQRQAGEGTAGPWASAGPPRAGRRRWPRARTSAPADPPKRRQRLADRKPIPLGRAFHEPGQIASFPGERVTISVVHVFAGRRMDDGWGAWLPINDTPNWGSLCRGRPTRPVIPARRPPLHPPLRWCGVPGDRPPRFAVCKTVSGCRLARGSPLP